MGLQRVGHDWATSLVHNEGSRGSTGQGLLFLRSWAASPSWSLCSPAQQLCEPHSSGIFMEALSCRHDPILTLPLAFSPLPEGWRDGSSNPLTMPWSFWGPVCILKLYRLLQPTVTSWTYKTLITHEMPRVLDALVSGTKVKDQIWEQKMLLAPRCLKWILGALC